MHNRGISLFLNLPIRIWVLLANSTPGAICYCTPGQPRTATGVLLFYGYTAGYLARILRLEYRSTRIWASIYGLAIVKKMGGYASPFSQLAHISKCILLMRMVLLPIRYDHYVNCTPGQLTKLMHLILLVHIYV